MNRNGPSTDCCRKRRVNRTNRVQALETQVEHQPQLRVLQQLAQVAVLAEFRPQVTCLPASRGSKHPMARSHSAFLGEWNSRWVGKPLGIRIVKLYVTDRGDDGITDEKSSTTPICCNLIPHKKRGMLTRILCQIYKNHFVSNQTVTTFTSILFSLNWLNFVLVYSLCCQFFWLVN